MARSLSPVIRWGVIGTGRIAHSFARDLATVADGRAVAVYARRLEAAQAFAGQYDIARATDDLEALLSDSDVDAVYVATPHTLHHDHACDALRAGKAVLCEKPLVIDPEECRALVAVTESTGGYLMEAMWTWFLPAIRTAMAWVQEGRIGALRHLDADFGYPQLPFDAMRREYDARLGGGCLLEMGVYPVALDWLVHRRQPLGVQARAHLAPNGVEDDVAWLLDHGASFSRLATSFRARLGNAATIVGEAGWIHIPDFFRASECSLFVLDTRVDHFREERTTIGLDYEIVAMQRDLREGRTESPVVRLADSLAFQEHMAAVRAAFAERGELRP